MNSRKNYLFSVEALTNVLTSIISTDPPLASIAALADAETL